MLEGTRLDTQFVLWKTKLNAVEHVFFFCVFPLFQPRLRSLCVLLDGPQQPW